MSTPPMDPKRLAELRSEAMFGAQPFTAQDMRDALSFVDHYRTRCSVTAADVEAVGVTREHVRTWMSSQGWAQLVPDGSGWETWAADLDQDSEVDVFHDRHDATPWLAVWFIAIHTERPDFDILDAIAKTVGR